MSLEDILRDIQRKISKVLSLLEENTGVELIEEKKGYRLMRVVGPYGYEYVVITPEGERYNYSSLRTARKWLERLSQPSPTS